MNASAHARRFLLLAALLVVLIVPGCHRAAHTVAAAPPRPTQYQVEIGRTIYKHDCQACHGDTGAGDGSNSFNLDPHPRDLGDPAFQKKKSDADLADAIRRGGSGVGLSALMPPWGHTLNDRQIDAVVVYVRSLKR